NCKKVLTDEFFGKVTLIQLEVSHHEMERAPVALDNPKWAKPFEFFYSFVKLPKYGGVDPTGFMAVFFPIIFGMMVGDIGYGIIIYGIAIMFKKASKGNDFAAVVHGVLKLSSIGAIVWGFVYYEAFGDLLEKMVPIHPHIIMETPFRIGFPLNRMEFMQALLVLSVVMGMTHIGFGLFYGIKNGLAEHNNKHALEKAGMLGIFAIGPLFLVLGVMGSFFTALGGIIMFAGLIATAAGGGIKGVIEIFGTLSNVFSYARIMAIGLAGVILGVVANELGKGMSGMGGTGMVIGGFFIAAFLHIINIVVSAFSPSIHTLRLHLVECFTKFYEPAESEYKPFKKTGGE
ncbi:MAG: V-type ATP synthase subunit I, partial [Candidatus Firestonebacteria bacterium]|nr:V-type ATP synthase subunit I [Candidatus Firestonebacteria bacterium]